MNNPTCRVCGKQIDDTDLIVIYYSPTSDTWIHSHWKPPDGQKLASFNCFTGELIGKHWCAQSFSEQSHNHG